MANDKKYYMCGFDQKTRNEGLWSLLKQGCTNLKIMNFAEPIFTIWKIALYCLLLMTKNIRYEEWTERPECRIFD